MSAAALSNISVRKIRNPGTGETREYFTGTLPSDKIKMLTFVPVVEMSKRTYLDEELGEGYQRPGSATRMRLFGDFVGSHPLSVVPPIILSGRNHWHYDADSECLLIDERAAIIDGQHRAGGFAYLYEQDGEVREVEFFLLPDLTLELEKQEFLTINTTQKGVPQSLNVFLSGSDDSIVADQLRTREDSPFHNRITQVLRQPGDLFTLAAVAKNVGRTFKHGAFVETEIDQRIEIMIQYWTIIADEFPEEWQDIDRSLRDQEFKLLETTGLIAWSLASEDILGPSFDPDSRTMNWDKVKLQVKKLGVTGALEWRKDGEFQGRTGEVGGRIIHKKMQLLLSAQQSNEQADELE